MITTEAWIESNYTSRPEVADRREHLTGQRARWRSSPDQNRCNFVAYAIIACSFECVRKSAFIDCYMQMQKPKKLISIRTGSADAGAELFYIRYVLQNANIYGQRVCKECRWQSFIYSHQKPWGVDEMKFQIDLDVRAYNLFKDIENAKTVQL